MLSIHMLCSESALRRL